MGAIQSAVNQGLTLGAAIAAGLTYQARGKYQQTQKALEAAQEASGKQIAQEQALGKKHEAGAGAHKKLAKELATGQETRQASITEQVAGIDTSTLLGARKATALTQEAIGAEKGAIEAGALRSAEIAQKYVPKAQKMRKLAMQKAEARAQELMDRDFAGKLKFKEASPVVQKQYMAMAKGGKDER